MVSCENNDWIVCFGGEDWWYHSHAHFDIQVMKCFSKRVSVLYVCSIGMRMPSLRRDKLFFTRIKRKLKSVSRLLQRITPQLYIYSPFPLPFYRSTVGRMMNTKILRTQLHTIYKYLGIRSPVVWVNTPTAWPLIEYMHRRGIVYQRTDDYAAYDFDNFNPDYVRYIDDKLVRFSDLVIHVSDELHQAALTKTSRSILLPQGVDDMFFDFKGSPPTDLDVISRPIIGYVGGMDSHKFDTKLVAQVARNLPDCSFVLVGPSNPNVEELNNLENVHFLGVKKHNEIPAYVHNFDICMLPTAKTEWGLKCRPLKLMEYLAAAKPVIATPTPASTNFAKKVLIASDASSWINTIQRIITNEKTTVSPKQQPEHSLKSWSFLSDELLTKLHDYSIL